MTISPFSRPRGWANPALAEAQRLFRMPTRKPTDADRQPVKPAPGPKIKPLPGQLDLEGNEVGAPPEGRSGGVKGLRPT